MTVHTRRKLVIVGDGACGKTCLLITFKMGELPDEEFLPATCDNFLVDVEVDGNYIELGLFDTVGQQEYDRFRPLSYSNSDIVLICYSISHPDSLESIVEKWVPEVFHFLSDRKVPFIVVGMKKDLRVHQPTLEALARHGQRPVTEAQGREVAERVGAIVYLECSAKTGEGVRVVFEHATRAALVRNKSKKRTGCLIV